jgi:hypothetical protein
MAQAQPFQGFHMRPIPSRSPSLPEGKTRRPVGDPVAVPKDPLRYEAPPSSPGVNLTLPLDVVAPQLAKDAEAAGALVFHCVGDTGGVHGDATQIAVAEAMEAQFSEGATKPAFLYHLGDVIYFNGQSSLYKAQFYEPYQFYPSLIFAIPGNHDGDTKVHPGDPPDPEPSLTGFMRNFCDTVATPVPYRSTMTQPFAYWTLDAPFVTIVGLYSNVEGCLDPRGKNDQQAWLTEQLKVAPADKKLLVTVHHPCYSLDGTHGGCPDILISLDRAIAGAGRIPDAVLSGHVHNYQRFSRRVNGRQVPYIVAGAGGYANEARAMHRLQTGLPANLPYQTTHQDVQMISNNWQDPGFLRVTATSKKITFDYFIVPFDGSPVSQFDSIDV